MTNKNSKIIRYLTELEINQIETEWMTLNHGWNSHALSRNKYYNNFGPLRHGKTFWIYKVDDRSQCVENRWKFLPNTIEVIKYLFEQYNYDLNNHSGFGIGRAYLHKLEPNQSIDLHDDRKMQFVVNLLHRYQLFLNVPNEFEIIMDNKKYSSEELKNSIVDFNLLLSHSYKNNSDKTVMFMVFDVMKSDFLAKNI
jgi:hypothetical protein